MKELSLNLLDVAQNSLTAGADLVEIGILADEQKDTLVIYIKDNGCGMTPEQVQSVTDPFFTTRTTRKVGLGIPLFKLAAQQTGGDLEIESQKGVGTKTTELPPHRSAGRAGTGYQAKAEQAVFPAAGQ